MNYLTSAADSGNVDALQMLAILYDGGVLTKYDPVRSYAYYKAAQLAMPSVIPDELIQTQKDKVPKNEISGAEQMAQNIYQKCCLN